VAKKRRVRVKQKILKVLEKMASRQEEGLTEIVRLVWKQYVKKARKKKGRKTKTAGSRKSPRAARSRF
jgi:hypothetical protein